MNIDTQVFIKRCLDDTEVEEVVPVNINDEMLSTLIMQYIKNTYGSSTELQDWVLISVQVD